MKKPHYAPDILFLTLLIGVYFFIGLGSRPLFVPDEGRYAEIAREMIANHDYITPYLNGIKYFEKPVLFYWLGVAAIKTGGLNLWSLRSINALLALAGCILTYLTGRILFNRGTGLLAAVILATSSLFYVMTHMISLDLPVTVFLSATLYAFILAARTNTDHLFRRYLYASAMAAALAVLTKGLIGIVFPAMIIGAWIIVTQQWRLLTRLPFIRCLLIFFLIAAPWHLLVGYRNPEFFYFYFIEQHFLRYATMDIGHYQPVWFFIPTLIIGFFPWIVFLPQTLTATCWPAIRRSMKTMQVEHFFLLWAMLVFLFFSFSKSKLIPYILPVFPPLAILTAHYLQTMFHRRPAASIKTGLLVQLILSCVIAYEFIQFAYNSVLPDPNTARIGLSIAAFILVAGSLLAAITAWRNTFSAIMITIVTSMLFLAVSLNTVSAIDTRTIQPLAITLKTQLTPDSDVITYNQYYQDLPFYLEKRVSILNWRNELSFGVQHQTQHDWLINDQTFWKAWQSHKRIFVIMSNDEFTQFKHNPVTHSLRVIDRTTRNILISNH